MNFELYIVSCFLLVIGFSFFILAMYKSYTLNVSAKQKDSFSLQNLTVIVPFRNEYKSLMPLLNSITKQQDFPAKYIFIDDHSTDNGANLIAQKLKPIANLNWQILKLNTNQKGKKAAIRFAMQNLNTIYFLIQDADVGFDKNFYSNIKNLPVADLYVLPVKMKSKNSLAHFYVIDHIFINALNYALAVFSPITASGANLIVSKAAFMQLSHSNLQESIASGDDQFILRHFKQAKKRIFTTAEIKHTVYTDAPNTMKSFIKQRLRWIGKTIKVKNNAEFFYGLLMAGYTFSFFIFLLYFFIKLQYAKFLFLFILKICTDLLILFPFLQKQKRLGYILYLPFFTLIYPVYSLLVMLLYPVYKPKWKGRKIYQ